MRWTIRIPSGHRAGGGRSGGTRRSGGRVCGVGRVSGRVPPHPALRADLPGERGGEKSLSTAGHEEERDALVGRLFSSTLGALELFHVYLGVRLGLYRALATSGPLTAAGLAAAAGGGQPPAPAERGG